MSNESRCELCGEPMPPGEEMFKYHGYSGPCPKPPLEQPEAARTDPSRADLERYLLQRVQQHSENLQLWQSGYLDPTEPDGQERVCVMRELKACLFEIRTLARCFGMQKVIDALPPAPE